MCEDQRTGSLTNRHMTDSHRISDANDDIYMRASDKWYSYPLEDCHKVKFCAVVVKTFKVAAILLSHLVRMVLIQAFQ